MQQARPEDRKTEMLVSPGPSGTVAGPDHAGFFVESAPAREVNLLFGARMHALRVQRSLSFEQLASRLMVLIDHVVELEAGRRSASIVDLDGLARVFKVSISELLYGL